MESFELWQLELDCTFPGCGGLTQEMMRMYVQENSSSGNEM